MKHYISRRSFLKAAAAGASVGLASVCSVSASACVPPELIKKLTSRWSEEATPDGYNLVTNRGGATLGYSPSSGVKLIEVDGYAFKDLAGTGELLPYEDWRLDADTRAADLAARLSPEQIAGLMCFSNHQFGVTEEVNETQKEFLIGGVRAVLNAASGTPDEIQIKWANAMQAYSESLPFGIPINFSSDPRNGNGVSNWPGNLGLAATFDPSIALEAGKVMSRELRDLGIATFLAPQIDVASDPRWTRFSGTFGEDPALSRDMTNQFVSGLQSTYGPFGIDLGWGSDSVNAMIKHWVSEGCSEGGREAHCEGGKYAVYPGNNFEAHLIPFVDGGLKLDSKTGEASCMMSSYTIAYTPDQSLGEYVGSGFSDYKINQTLRQRYGFKGSVCTDWGVIGNTSDFMHTNWGLEDDSLYDQATRAFLAFSAGVDQIGGCDDPAVTAAAYDEAVAAVGEEAANEIFRTSATRLLRGYFKTGLFENPYLDVQAAVADVNCEAYNAAALEAQVKAIVMLKNNGAIAARSGKPTVYVPKTYTKAYNRTSFLGGPTPVPASFALPIKEETLSKYFNVVTDPDAADLSSEANIQRATAEQIAACDFVLVKLAAPDNYDPRDGRDPEGNFIPLSLQYGPYTADSEYVRQTSIAGDPTADGQENRSYYGRTAIVNNDNALGQTLAAAQAAKAAGIPCIVVLDTGNPVVVGEFEPSVDAILVSLSGCDEAACIIAAGQKEPSGLLPMQFPRDMLEVEKQYEDVPRDVIPYTDAAGHTYDFAYGMNYSGVIQDKRVQKYGVAPLTRPANMGV